jgi:hypothetical protein
MLVQLPVFDQDRARVFYTGRFACQVAANEKMGDSGRRWIERSRRTPGRRPTECLPGSRGRV